MRKGYAKDSLIAGCTHEHSCVMIDTMHGLAATSWLRPIPLPRGEVARNRAGEGIRAATETRPSPPDSSLPLPRGEANLYTDG